MYFVVLGYLEGFALKILPAVSRLRHNLHLYSASASFFKIYLIFIIFASERAAQGADWSPLGNNAR